MIFIANQFVGKNLSTGGDILAVEMAKRIRGKLTILAPIQIHAQLSKALPKATLITTNALYSSSATASTLYGGISIFISYLIRSWRSTSWLLKNIKSGDRVYLTGDFICNTLPAWIIKMVKPETIVLANFYHRNPRPNARLGNNYVVSAFSRFLQNISLKILRKIIFKIFVLSKVGEGELVNEGFISSQIIVSGAGTNIDKQRRNLARKKNQIVFVGRINITKGAFDLIEIFNQVAKKNNKVRLIMLGGSSGADKSKLEKLIKDYSLGDRIRYLGFVDEITKNKILSESKALVLPSKEEGFGIVIMEALALRTPAVCYDLLALKTIFSRYQSVNFVKKFTKQKFADKIIKVVSEKKEVPVENLGSWDDVYKIQSKYFSQ